MWSFMDYYMTLASVSLVIQLVVLAFLVVGLLAKSKKQFRRHGLFMFVAVVLHLSTVFAVMLPSFYGFTAPGAIDFSNMLVVLSLIHGFTGLGAIILGLWLIVAWRFRENIKTCFGLKNLMRVTLSLWLVSLILGIYMYWVFYL